MLSCIAPLKGREPGLKHQPYDRPNPFDRKTEEGEPLLEIAFDTQSFADQLVSGDPDDPALTRVLQLAGFPFLRVVALPTDKPEITQVLEKQGVLVAEKQDRSGILIVREETESMSRSMMLDQTDMVVTRGSTSSSSGLPRSFWRSSPAETLELVRLLLVSKGVFEATPVHRVDETLYSIYRRWKVFPGSQAPWSIAVYCEDEKSFPDGLFEQLKSLCLRQELLCRSSDQCRVHAYGPLSNHHLTEGLYHFAYFVMLVTGLFDDLAWLAYKFHQIKPKDKKDVDLRWTNFRRALDRVNPSLEHYLARIFHQGGRKRAAGCGIKHLWTKR